MNGTLLSIQNLKTYFDLGDKIIRAVDGVTFTLKEGEVLGLAGETGCGKTVLGRSIICLIPNPPGKICDGRIIFKQRDILRLSERELRKIRGKEISMIFQEPSVALDPCFTVGSQIAEAIQLHQGTNNRETWERVLEIMEKVGIADPKRTAREYPHQFSGGMKQRIMIAIALACRPSLLIADEPTTALDLTIQLQILRLLQKLKKEFDTSIILISHDMEVIAEMCNKLAIMYMGKIVEFRDVDNFFDHPMHPYSVGLLKSIPSLETERSYLDVIRSNVEAYTFQPHQCKFLPRCDRAISICHQEEPPVKDIVGGTVSCHLF